MKYFKTDYAYFMVLDDVVVRVGTVPNTRFNQIQTIPKVKYHLIDKKTPISETEFKNEFLRVSLLIEETINN